MDAYAQLHGLPPLLSAVVWAYLLTNALRVVTYLPQIIAVWRDTQGAQTISLLTWASWTLSHVFALAYALLVVVDVPLALISVVNLVGCAFVTGIGAHRRLQWRRCAADSGAAAGGLLQRS